MEDVKVAVSARGQVYQWQNVAPPHSHSYVRPEIERILSTRTWPPGARVLDFGCGNGSFAHWLSTMGFAVTGVDLSSAGIAVAKNAFPEMTFSNDLSAENIERLGPFDLASCIEVIAHCFDPEAEIKKIFDNLKPGGTFVLVTPYYGYLKILALALTDRLKKHQSVASSAAYVNLFTPYSIADLLERSGFRDIGITRVGRISPLAKAMIVVAQKPDEPTAGNS